MRVVFKSFLLAFFLVSAVFAALLPGRASAQADSVALAQTHDQAMHTPAGAFIQSLGDRAITVIADKSLSASQRGDQFRAILNDCFDLKTIGRFVIGRTWNAATPEQQQEYMSLFAALVIKSYGDRLALYTGEGFTVRGVRTESEQDVVVASEITHPDGSEPTAIDWRVRNKNGKLGVIDVVVEGVSLSVTQRQEYASVIQNNGGSIEGLLAVMRRRLQATDAAAPG